MSQLLSIMDKACTLLGSSLSTHSDRYSKAQTLCQSFMNAAIEEVYLAIPWPFGLERILREYESPKPEEFVCYRNRADVDYADVLKILTYAPSNLEWFVMGHGFFFKGQRLKQLVHWSVRILDELKAHIASSRIDQRAWGFGQIPDSFVMLAAYNLATNVAYPLHGDATFTDGIRLQYLKKLEECKRLYATEWHIQDAYHAVT